MNHLSEKQMVTVRCPRCRDEEHFELSVNYYGGRLSVDTLHRPVLGSPLVRRHVCEDGGAGALATVRAG